MEPLEEKTQDEQQTQEPEMDEQGSAEVTESEKPEGLEVAEKEPAQEDSHSSEGAPDEGSVEATQSPEGKEEALMEMYEESIRRVREGEIVQGKIIQVDKEFVLVDIGYKSEGQVPIDEFVGPDGTVEAVVGDTIEIMVERWEDEDGGVRLSKEKASRVKVWDDIKKAYEDDGVVQGTVSSRIKGGLSVDIGIPAFLPGSQVDLRPVRDLDQMVGNTFDFKVLKYNRKRSNVVLSRRVILEKEREAKRAETLATIHEGKVMEGVVKNITEYGVFVDLGGIDGLLHITDMSWGRVNYPSEMFSMGDDITVKVLNLDLERERVSLGLKQLVPDPWTTAEEKYPIGSHVVGRVVSLTDYGAFVELEKGVEGLIHVSEMSWTRKIRHPSKVVSVGETVEAVVLNISAENRRISLGMKQVVPNPWDVIAEKYPVGTTIEGKIKNITDFGLFIGIDEGIDGLVHISDISWTKRIRHPSELYKKGDEIQAVVLNIDKENERFSLGIKQLQRDPWEAVPERYNVGSKITGTVTNVTDFGVFVELEEGIEGLVHVSEVTREKLKTPLGRLQVGEIVSAKVLNVNPKERRIGLSIKQIEVDEEHDLVSDYLTNYSGPASSLGEVLKENLKEKAPDDSVPEAPETSAEEPEPAEAETEKEDNQGEEDVLAPEADGDSDEVLTEGEDDTAEGEDDTAVTASTDGETVASGQMVEDVPDATLEEPVEADIDEDSDDR
ncbi:MAG: 30S ribosomal protein S1 [Thermodesulfobacteriota bacterium]|nr:30S ribosomal protein S1 [Thermodesulfobacteriota bacterium]